MWPFTLSRVRRPQHDFDNEVRSHLELEEDRLVRQGVSRQDAHDAARRAFGNVTTASERFFESRRVLWLQRLGQDLRYVGRTVRRNPGFAFTALATLAIGIGVNTSLFSLLYSLALRPLPVRDPSSVVNVYQGLSGRFSREVRGSLADLSYQEFQQYARTRSLEGLAAYAGQMGFSLAGDEAERVHGQFASCNYFQVLRVRMALGRPFAPEECRGVGGAPVAVVSHGLWRRRFGADSAVVGRIVVVNGVHLTVVGVAEEGFQGTDIESGDLWVPVTLQPSLMHGDSLILREASWLTGIGRLKSGVSSSRAAAELTVIARANDALHPGRTTRTIVMPGSMASSPDVRREGGVLALAVLALAGLIVLLVCVNIMNLLLARAASRTREIAVRLSLGASRSRVVTQLLTESVVLSISGGLLGLVVAATLPKVLLRTVAAGLQLDTSPDTRTFAYALLVSLLAAVAFGLVPALQSTSLDLTRALRGGAPVRAQQRRSGRLRNLLVGVQVAGSAFLLVMAGLFLRGLARAERLDPGYVTHGVLWATLNLEDLGYNAQRAGALHALLRERLVGLSGVRGVANARVVPLIMHRTSEVTLSAMTPSIEGAGTQVGVNVVSREYFGVLGIPLARGRLFTEPEARAGSGETPVVVSETMANLLQASGTEPLGARFSDGSRRLVVTGIAKDVQNGSLARVDGPYVYEAASPDSLLAARIVVRHEGPPAEIVRALEEVARRFDPALLVRTESFETSIDRVLQPVRITALLASVLGVLATLLALVGVYGTVSFTAAQRTREIGVRIALGARPRDVIRLVTGQGMRVVVSGLVTGSLGAAAASRLMRAALFGLSPLDPIAFLAIAALVLGASMIAVWRPARRAARLAPMVALRID